MGMMLYNGVVLPDIESVWDKKNYPYAFIYRADPKYGSGYVLYTAQTISNNYVNGDAYVSVTNGRFYKSDGTSAWEYTNTGSSTLTGLSLLVWVNFNIYTDSTMTEVYLPASDPIPVETPIYRKQNGSWVKKTAYQRINGKWVLISKGEPVVKTYNLLSFGGSYTSKLVDSKYGESESVTFEPGECPLSISKYKATDNVGTSGLEFITLFLNVIPEIKAGSRFDAVFLFPTATLTGANYEYKSYNLSLISNVAGSKVFRHRSTIGYVAAGSGNLYVADNVLSEQISQNITCEKVLDSSGTLVGFRANGTLDFDLAKVELDVTFRGLPTSGSFFGTLTKNYKSYDDFTLVVEE